MSPDEFVATCQMLWGDRHHWGGANAADFLRVTVRNVNYWAAGTKEIPAGVVSELRLEVIRRLMDPQDTTPALTLVRSAYQRISGNLAA